MGLTVQWALKCKEKTCVRRFIDGMFKLAVEDPNISCNKTGAESIIVSTGEDGIGLHFRFEPWEKAVNQSYVMKRARFQVLGFGDPVFDGIGPFGHHIPDEMLNLLGYGTSYKTMDGPPVLGKGGFQTGDFTKTQYAGIEHHIKACKILDKARVLSDKAIIGDDGHYCGDGDKHDLSELNDNFEEYTKINIRIGEGLKKAGWKDEQMIGAGSDTYKKSKAIKK